MLGSLASIPISDGDAEALGRRLLDEHGIEVPVFGWPAAPRRLLRVSAQLYNTIDQYERLKASGAGG
jgi:isopenicillin-N epimerase